MLSFSEWEKKYYSVDESLENDVYNWLSKNFGGRVSKLDGIISDLVREEKNYAKEWESVQYEISSMRDQIKTGEISDEEGEDFKKKIKQKEEEIQLLNRKRIQKIRALSDEAEAISDGNSRLSKYWNLKKAEAEVTIAENLYRISKSLPDQKVEDHFYKNYKQAQQNLSSRRKGIEKISIELEEDPISKPEKKPEKSSIDVKDLIRMNMYDFKGEVSDYTSSQIKEIRRGLIDRKNELLNRNRSLQREKRKALERAAGKEKQEVYAKYNPKIAEMGEILDKVREKIRYIDAKYSN